MNKTFEQLIEYAETHMDKAMADEPSYAVIHTQAAIASALIAIAQELHFYNVDREYQAELQQKRNANY